MESLRDRVVLVTGSSSGIGLAAARAFAGAGARVAIAARGVERGEAAAAAIRAEGGRAQFIAADLSVASDVSALVSRTVAAFGRLDAAFNNAADESRTLGETAELSDEQFDHALVLNLKSVWLCMKHEIRQMLAQVPPGGAIVNTSSINGLGGVPGAGLYAAAKAGVLALTKSAAREHASRGIRVNALVPGAFRTAMLERALRDAGGDEVARRAAEQRYAQAIPLGRIGGPEEAAAAAVWLCSDAASFVTGLSMIVDGGMTSSVR
jgi:NAD(P)-dependent dehydrogenase (short-subunit alcohol dehydrogenase family)